MMPVAKYQPQSLRTGFLRQNLLNTHEAFLCLAQSILVTRAQPHTWVLSVIAFGESHSEWSKHFLVRNEHQFPSLRIDFTPRTYFVRPTESLFTANNKARNLVPRELFPSLVWRLGKRALETRLQSSQYLILRSQAWDQSFNRMAKWDEIREDIGRSRLCQSWVFL